VSKRSQAASFTSIAVMTIARDTTSEYGFEATQPIAVQSGIPVREMLDEAVPVEIRADRLTQQILNFERAGYRLETRSALQAVLVKPRERRPLRSALLSIGTLGLYLVPLVLGARRAYHRVVVTVDRSGSVRFA
jgi:hypothetical protein